MSTIIKELSTENGFNKIDLNQVQLPIFSSEQLYCI